MELISHRRHAVNITQPERYLSAAGGCILLIAAVKKCSALGLATLFVGADLIRRGITGHSFLLETLGLRTAAKGQGWETTSVPYELGIRVDRSITINRPRAEVFHFWRDLTNLPRFMSHIKSVRMVDENRSHWVVTAPTRRDVEWDAVIHNEIADRLIAWRTLPGAEVDHAGSVWFKDSPSGGTDVSIELQYNPPGGVIGATVAKLWGEEPSQQIEADLWRLKENLEAGDLASRH